jgi:gluconolactonase
MVSPVPERLALRVLADGLDHVEGVCWDPLRRCIWAGGEAGQVYRVDLDGAVQVISTILGGALLGVALGGRGRLYICDPGNHQVWRVFDDGAYEPFGDPIGYPNYASFAADGNLYVSDSGSFDEASGKLFVIEPDRTTTPLDTRQLSYANGLCVGRDRLWVVESRVPGVAAMPLDGDPIELVAEMARCNPDGLALDSEAGLLISCYQPNQLWRWTEESGCELLFDDWTGEYVLSPTNVAFYGEGLDQLALACLCGRRINSIEPPYRGAALYYPDVENTRR